MNGGPLSWVIGNWRLAGTHFYSSGFPLSLGNSNNYLIFNGRGAATVSTYENWIVNQDNPDWKGSDRFFQPSSYFGPQPLDRLGNATRFNPNQGTAALEPGGELFHGEELSDHGRNTA